MDRPIAATLDDEDTEWNDILREKGIIPTKEPTVTEEQLGDMLDAVIRGRTDGKDVADMDIAELDALLDDDGNADVLADDRIVQQYRQRRIAEMQNYARAARYGSVLPLQKAEYAVEVNEASKTDWVVVFLFQDHIPACKLMASHLDVLARRYPHTKFMKIRADLCIERYPDKNCPTLIVYHDGELQKHLAGPIAGTESSTVESLESMLKAIGALGKPNPAYAGSSGLGNTEHNNGSYSDRNDDDEDDEFGSRSRRTGIRKGTAFTRADKKNAGADDDWD